jgi:hypothetical protein
MAIMSSKIDVEESALTSEEKAILERAKKCAAPLSAMERKLLEIAAGRIGKVLRPYPWESVPERQETAAAVESLRERGFVHGPEKSPNLTGAGVEYIQQLAAEPEAGAKAR